jgi:hypothetical protein
MKVAGELGHRSPVRFGRGEEARSQTPMNDEASPSVLEGQQLRIGGGRRVEVDQVDGRIGQVATQDVEAVAVVTRR